MPIFPRSIWKHPKIIWTILTCGHLDPLVIFKNPPLFIAFDDDTVSGFCCVVSHGQTFELKSVYVYPHYRGRGVMTKLLNQVLPGYTPLYLLCRTELIKYYENHAFIPTEMDDASTPHVLKIKCTVADFFAKHFRAGSYVIMRRATP